MPILEREMRMNQKICIQCKKDFPESERYSRVKNDLSFCSKKCADERQETINKLREEQRKEYY